MRPRLDLKFAIIAAGKTQRQVAAECSPRLSENRLSELIRGWSDPRPEEKEALACVLGRPVDQLFDSEQPAGTAA